ncbi:MAG TPA: choice-of-anchor V domain-containing protein [Flavipsychrobacter sp.]|nr:choice-of-anchor V domain-containing protein [Flavipsychrobacter sp.]
MKKNYKTLLSLMLVTGIGALSIQSASGPATNLGENVTGAPFDNGTCNNCHGGGSWSATVGLQLLSGSTPVTSYTPGASYTVRITRSFSATLPLQGGFGFQMTSATGSANTNYNGWGALPTDINNELLNGRNYIEHTAKLPRATTQVNIPWTAPASASAGSVSFWIALNTVNGDGGTSNDQVMTTSMVITASPTPVTWLYFKGNESDGKVILEWATATEKNNQFFTIERSKDGKDFEPIATIDSRKTEATENRYVYVDRKPDVVNYYRIKNTDVNGECSYFNTLQINTAQSSNQAFHYLQDNKIVVQLFAHKTESTVLRLYDISGKCVARTETTLTDGANSIEIEKPQTTGIYFIDVKTGEKPVYSAKAFVN